MTQVYCSKCEKSFLADKKDYCKDCNNNLIVLDPEFLNCPVCGCKNLYVKKNFNQLLGCLIIFIGAVLVPLTYGISLLVLALFDYLLYKRVEDCLQCYKCKLEFRGANFTGSFDSFDHHIAELYEK